MNLPIIFERMSDAPDRVKFRWLIGTLIAVSILFAAMPAWAETRLPHPSGCPARAFCGCGAAVDLFGHPVRSLWLAASWFKFPRTQPARNMVAVRRHHVFVLKEHVSGNLWKAADYNSGKHESRIHIRSIAGFTIVDPFAHSRFAEAR
jgi:hypothetical protein